MTVYLPIRHVHSTRTGFTVLVSCNDELACGSLRRYIVCRGRLRNLGAESDSSKYGLYCVSMPGQQRFASSNGSKGFVVCGSWTQTSVAGNAARQWLLIAVRHVVLYGVKRSTAANEAHSWECCRHRASPTRRGAQCKIWARGPMQDLGARPLWAGILWRHRVRSFVLRSW